MSANWTAGVLEPGFLAGLDRLALARRLRSLHAPGDGPARVTRAGGLDWIDHRPYEQGDDLRTLDWHLLARTDRLYVRRFVAERSARLDILVDRSRSMTMGRPPKGDTACALAFSIAYVALAAGDRVGMTLFAEKTLTELPAGRGASHRASLFRFLCGAPWGADTSLAARLDELGARTGEVGRVVVVSDLLADDVEPALARVRRRGFEIALVRLRTEQDDQPDVDGEDAVLEDVETGRRRAVTFGPAERADYRMQRRVELEKTAATCARIRVPFAALRAERSLPDLVFRDLRASGLFL